MSGKALFPEYNKEVQHEKQKRETAQIRDSVSLHLPGDCDEPYIFLSSVFTVAFHVVFLIAAAL